MLKITEPLFALQAFQITTMYMIFA